MKNGDTLQENLIVCNTLRQAFQQSHRDARFLQHVRRIAGIATVVYAAMLSHSVIGFLTALSL